MEPSPAFAEAGRNPRPRRRRLAEWTPVPAWPKNLGLAGRAFIALLEPGLERRSEADLSTKQACAQAPAWVSCPDGYRGRPQGYRGAARARPQTAVRVNPSTIGLVPFDVSMKYPKPPGSRSSGFPAVSVLAKPLDQPHGNALAAPERLRRRADFLRTAKGMRFSARGLTLQAAPRPDAPPETLDWAAPCAANTFGAGTRTDQTGNPLDVLPCLEAAPRFGFTVTKQSGGAVRRNRIRRRLKEALRLLNPLPARPGHDYVILARPAALGMPFLTLQAELLRAFDKIGTAKNSPPIRHDREGRVAADADATRRQRSKGRNKG